MKRRLSSTLPYFSSRRGASLARCRCNDSNLQRQIARARIFTPGATRIIRVRRRGIGRTDSGSAAAGVATPAPPRRPASCPHPYGEDLWSMIAQSTLEPGKDCQMRDWIRPLEFFRADIRISLSAHGRVTKRFSVKHVFIAPLLRDATFTQRLSSGNVYSSEKVLFSLSLSRSLCCILCTLLINLL